MKQRGNADLYVVLAILALGIASIWGLKHWVGKWEDSLIEEGREEVRLQVAKRDNEQMTKARAEIARLQAEKDALEAQRAADVAAIDKEGQRRLKDVQTKHDRLAAVVAAGARLRDPGRTFSACPGSGGSQAGQAASPSGVGNAAAGSELSVEAGSFLLAEAQRADQVVVQLSACQKIVEDDRK